VVEVAGFWEPAAVEGLTVTCQVVIDLAARRAEREAGKQFARDQRAGLLALGFGEGAARRIIPAGDSGYAVAAAQWVVSWMSEMTTGAAEDHNWRYMARELILTTVAGLLRSRGKPPYHEMAAVLRTVGAPGNFPGGFRRMLKFLRSAEEAAVAYFGRRHQSGEIT
jgi:hypothetical protein